MAGTQAARLPAGLWGGSRPGQKGNAGQWQRELCRVLAPCPGAGRHPRQRGDIGWALVEQVPLELPVLLRELVVGWGKGLFAAG